MAKKIISLFLLISFGFMGCSVYMASKQPAQKDIGLFKVGTPRNILLAEFGKPVVSEIREDGKKYDIFAFTQGYSNGARTGRAIFHGVADIATLGLWEAIGTPTEGAFDGTEMAYEVRYNENNIIDQVLLLKKK